MIKGIRIKNPRSKGRGLRNKGYRITKLSHKITGDSTVEIVILEAKVVTWTILTNRDSSLALMRQFAST